MWSDHFLTRYSYKFNICFLKAKIHPTYKWSIIYFRLHKAKKLINSNFCFESKFQC
jgi:hypothetical protein